MKKSNVVKKLGKISDYFFGIGDKNDYYSVAREYNWAFEDDSYKKLIEDASLISDKTAKIFTRSCLTLLEFSLVSLIGYHTRLEKITPGLFVPIILGESIRAMSLFIDYKNKKRVLRKKNETIENLMNQNLEDVINDNYKREFNSEQD